MVVTDSLNPVKIESETDSRTSDIKDIRQLELLEKFIEHPDLTELIKSQIRSNIKSTRIVENESYNDKRYKRRKRNTLLANISVQLGLAEQPLNLPFELMIEPTSFCNLKCPLCPTGNGTMSRVAGRMKLEQFTRLIDSTEDEVRRIVFWGFGEPFLHKDATKMIRYASDRKIHVITSTNGTLLNNPALAEEIVDSGLHTLYIALDGLTQETLSKYRIGADIQEILSGVKLIKDIRKNKGVTTPELIMQFVVTKDNEKELELAETFFKSSGFDKWSVKSANVMATTDSPDFDKLAEKYIPTSDKISRFRRTSDGKLRIKGELQNSCNKLFTQTMINWNGDVVPCCWDAQSEHVLGNVFEGDISTIWFGDRYKKFRETVYENREKIKICCDCPTDRTENKLSRRFTTRGQLTSGIFIQG